MTTENPIELPEPFKVIYGQNLSTWRRLDEMRPLLDMLSASKDPETEAARRDLAEVLGAIDATTRDILRRQSMLESQLKEMGATLSMVQAFLDRMGRHLP